MREVKYKAWVKNPTYYLKKENINTSAEYHPKYHMVDVQIHYLSKNKIRGKWNINEKKPTDCVFINNKGSRDFEEFILLEFTNSKDKNNDEIYDGHILEDVNGKRYVVKWSISSNGFIAQTNEKQGNTYSLYHLAPETKIVGHIHEQGDMLAKRGEQQ